MLANAPLSFKSGLQGPTAMSTMEAEPVASALAMKEAVFCSNMLTELGFGKEFAQVLLFCDNTATPHALGNRSFQLENETHLASFLLHPTACDRGKYFHSIHPPCRHRDQTPEQASVQAPDGPHLKLRRQRLHQQQVQMMMLYFCVFVLNLSCLRESAYSFGSRHSASHHHWLNEPCRIESSSSLVCA